MASDTLTTGSSSGAQQATDSPQTSVVPTNLAGPQSSGVQPGTATSLLNSQGGIPLTVGTLSTVSLAPATTTTSTSASTQPKAHHGTNPVLLGLTVVLFAIAIFLFWLTSRSEKNTTK